MAKDPYRYFRIEARELIESLALEMLTLEQKGGREAVSALLRHAHTLKGAARVVKQGAIADLAHALEEQLVPLRAQDRVATRQELDACLTMIDRMRGGLRLLDVAASETPQAQQDAPGLVAPARNVRIDSADTDALVEGLASAGRELAEIDAGLSGLDEARGLVRSLAGELEAYGRQRAHPALARCTAHMTALEAVLARTQREAGNRMARLQRMLAELLSRGDRMRLESIATIFAPLERVVRDAARELERQVRWEPSGGEIGVDNAVLTVVAAALPHVVRNAITHGIESPAERQAAGKPAAGSVRLRCSRRGNHIAIALSDDGRGIDFAAVRSKAIERGALSAADPDDHDALIRVLLAGGLSTSAEVTGIAGRGVGLDVMRSAVERLHGTVSLSSEAGRGTTLEVLVPATLASVPSLIAHAGESLVAIPLDAVGSTRRIADSEVVRSGVGEAVVVDDRQLPMVALSTLIGARAAPRPERSHRTVVVLASGRSEAAVDVDRLIGTAEVTVRPFPSGVRPVAVLSGAGVDDAGAPRLVLDAAAAIAEVRAPHTGGARLTPSAEQARRLPILVVDDSLTTRTLEQSILESAGYEVDIAVSAEQALVMAGNRRYGLFVVDVEMPGMDGFTFVSTTRAHPQHRLVPAILVTSRAEPEDRRRGAEVGASAYIVKAEFEQRHLLDLIRGVLG